MARRVAAIVKNSHNIYGGPVAAPIEQDVPRIVHSAQGSPGPVAAESQVVGADVLSQFWPLLQAGTLRIGFNIAQPLYKKGFIPKGRAFAEFRISGWQ